MKLLNILFFFTLNFLVYSQQIDIIGKSVNGSPIKLYKFGKGEDLIIIIAGIHGNEKNTSNTAYSIINLLQKGEITFGPNKMLWIIPVLNPDGFKQNKRTNANDVDLNRNFDTSNWQPKSIKVNEILNCGEFPFSEPESLSIKSLFESIEKNITPVIISLHSYGDALIPADDSYKNIELVNILKKELSYTYDSVGYYVSGDLTQWASEKLNIAGVTIEFKTKDKEETDEIIKLIESLNKINFKERIYKKDIFSFLNGGNNFNIINKLTENIIEKLKKIKNGEKIFLDYFSKIPKEDELLLLVNKSNKLSQNYVPSDLIYFTNKDLPSDKENFQLREIIVEDLKNMIEDAKKDGVNLIIISAYRSYDTQKNLYEYWVNKLGKKEADRVSAKPGASQHQLGTTIDFNSLNVSFENTKEGEWLMKNAYKYGFIMSYPKNMEHITGYAYEPWHYRYVGKEASYLIYNFFDNCLEYFLIWYWGLHKD
ncbi:MAG TPA: DUF2817 domain-containing protein [Spirochaetota bacterium]|nr:DUF2817 domain-containing protein [Spirochaetota bacterium]